MYLSDSKNKHTFEISDIFFRRFTLALVENVSLQTSHKRSEKTNLS
jgi:hypothetical protein